MKRKPKIAIIDHQDSFTYNLVQLFEEAGATVEVIPYRFIKLKELAVFEGIVLSPGPGLPKDYPKSIELIKHNVGIKPIFGVCMGLQLLVHYFEGSLFNLKQVNHGKQASIRILKEEGIFNGLGAEFKVGLYHSWALDKMKPLIGMEITAITKDGVAMGLQNRKLKIDAVQFHPESYMTEKGKEMVKNWLSLLH